MLHSAAVGLVTCGNFKAEVKRTQMAKMAKMRGTWRTGTSSGPAGRKDWKMMVDGFQAVDVSVYMQFKPKSL